MSDLQSFESVDSVLNVLIDKINNEKKAWTDFTLKISFLQHDSLIFKDFFNEYVLNESQIKIEEFIDLNKKFDKLPEKISEMKISSTITDSNEYINNCNNNSEKLNKIEEELDALFEIIKKKVKREKDQLIRNKELYIKTLNLIVDIKFENDIKEGFLSKIEEITNKMGENALPIYKFLKLTDSFSYWIYDHEPKVPEDDRFVISEGEYRMVNLEKKLIEFYEKLNDLKQILLDNCGKYGEFYIELNKILEDEDLTEFLISDIEKNDIIKQLFKELGDDDLVTVLKKLSDFGLITTKYSID